MESRKAEIMAKMDEAAEIAEQDLDAIVRKYPDACKDIAKWAKKHYLSAGYKRLWHKFFELAG